MLSDKIKQFISINVTGHVFMFCTREGIKDPKQIRQYEKRTREHLEQKALEGADIRGVEKELKAFLEQLRNEIHGDVNVAVDDKPAVKEQPKTAEKKLVEPGPETQPDPEKPQATEKDKEKETGKEKVKEQVAYSDDMFAEEEAQLKEEESRRKAEKEKARKEREKRSKQAPAKQDSARMDEKLAIQRKPIQELLTKECVEFKLLTPEWAKHWVFNLSGRRIEDVEKDIVDELRQKLHDNVKSYIRKNKKENPWPSPALQEELRMEISQVKTIKGMLMLSSNILWEIRNAKQSGKVSLFNRIKKKITGE